MQPLDVVKLLNNLFSRFDELVEVYGLNKVCDRLARYSMAFNLTHLPFSLPSAFCRHCNLR